MNDEQLLRYSRQIFLPEIDLEGQERLLGSTAAIIGLGGLGSPVAMYLAAAGVGKLVLVDFDRVDLSNLQRQIVHSTPDIGKLKCDSAQEKLLALNPECHVTLRPDRLNETQLYQLAKAVSVVIDCTDNFTARYAINAACVRAGTPLVSAAAIRFEAQISVFNPAQGDSPCYACLYPGGDETSETCTQAGVIAPLLGIVGSMQALEAIKLLSGVASSLVGRLLLFDALRLDWQSLRVRRDPDCAVCGQRV